jgi:hypothetical protein
MFSLPKLNVDSLPLHKLCKNSCSNIVFGVVLAFLVMVVLQSLDSEIAPSFPMFKSQNNLCLKKMDIINEKCLFGILDNPIIIFMFILLLNFVLTYLVFTMFQNVFKNKSNICEGLTNSVKCPIMMGGNKPKHIIMGDTVADYLTGCPLGFGKKKPNNVMKECNFIDECMLMKETMGDIHKKNAGDNVGVDVKVATNVDLNDENGVGNKLVKNILGKLAPGLLPNIIETITKKCDEKKCDEKKCDEKKCDEKKCDEKKCDEKKCDEKDELVDNIKNIMTKVSGLLKDGNINMQALNLDLLI